MEEWFEHISLSHDSLWKKIDFNIFHLALTMYRGNQNELRHEKESLLGFPFELIFQCAYAAYYRGHMSSSLNDVYFWPTTYVCK